MYYHLPGDKKAKYCGGQQRLIDNYPEGHKMGMLSMNFDFAWLCNINGDGAKLTMRAYSTCASGKCGFMTDANGFEEIQMEKISFPWTQYRATTAAKETNVRKGGGGWNAHIALKWSVKMHTVCTRWSDDLLPDVLEDNWLGSPRVVLSIPTKL